MRNTFGLPLIASLLLSLPAWAAPPQVIKTTPENGAMDVNPATNQIRVTFDQPMSRGGHSIVGGGPNFPKITGRPTWADARTIVIAVQLEADHEYALSINSHTFTNFRSAQGEAAVPYPISFRTAAKAEEKRLTPEQNRKSIDQLRDGIDQKYSYRDLRNVDWDAAFKEYTPRLLAAQTPAQFAELSGKMLARAQDLHIWIEASGRSFPSHRRSVPPNLNRITLGNEVPSFRSLSSAVFSGRFDEGIGYILIATWSSSKPELIEPAYDALKEFADCKAVIIDVRPNAGGDEVLARQFAGCFVAKPAAYAKHIVREEGKFTEVSVRQFGPNLQRPTYRGKVAVLMGPHIMSSCESFLLMMKQVPGCKLIGDRSYGSSGNPRPLPLENGVTVYLPCWQDLLLDGTCFEGKGIEPDIPVRAESAEFLKGDPVLQAALKELRK